MPLPESATPTRLSHITPALVDTKLRVMGRMLAYDAHTALLLLYDAGCALLIDVSLCVGAEGGTEWVGAGTGVERRMERMEVMQVLGYLERTDGPDLPIPDLPAYAPAPSVDPSLVLRALLVRSEGGDADVKLWNEVLAELEGVDAEVPVPPANHVL
ncbi:hypothetical protein FIBSPDRAFT_762 [Athelia psychrophila]|uniref:Uncharacterized protein n=1 Tax=Athelia psychrophila TaxID=1759441 RepID=A0A166WW41_9AGAM|nr:hypothetical protein FIBSPDRAFT_899302 [Fibularhizoctonia sp. CBS 109695]KZP34168.1 hypothetical protein FIBSPDRAFT_762 [Fibularhizoctonia sp. CBS 109695]